jgi:hypothetical protein
MLKFSMAISFLAISISFWLINQQILALLFVFVGLFVINKRIQFEKEVRLCAEKGV